VRSTIVPTLARDSVEIYIKKDIERMRLLVGGGILEDRGGATPNRNGKVLAGRGGAFRMGVQVDASGDDRYNVGNDTAVNQ